MLTVAGRANRASIQRLRRTDPPVGVGDCLLEDHDELVEGLPGRQRHLRVGVGSEVELRESRMGLVAVEPDREPDVLDERHVNDQPPQRQTGVGERAL